MTDSGDRDAARARLEMRRATVVMTEEGRAAAGRFWSKVDKDAPNGCWQWRGYCHPTGYGRFSRGKKEYWQAHRFSYELLIGPIPEGLTLDHLCRNRGCVNPAHLEAVTIQVNLARGTSPSALNARKTHCKFGHEFTPENTATTPQGRACRTCWADKERARAHARRKPCADCGMPAHENATRCRQCDIRRRRLFARVAGTTKGADDE